MNEEVTMAVTDQAPAPMDAHVSDDFNSAKQSDGAVNDKDESVRDETVCDAPMEAEEDTVEQKDANDSFSSEAPKEEAKEEAKEMEVDPEDLEEGEIEDDEEEAAQEAPEASGEAPVAKSESEADEKKRDRSKSRWEKAEKKAEKKAERKAKKEAKKEKRKKEETEEEEKRRILKEKLRKLEKQMAAEDDVNDEEMGIYASGGSPPRIRTDTTSGGDVSDTSSRSRSPGGTKLGKRKRGASGGGREGKRSRQTDRVERQRRREERHRMKQQAVTKTEICKMFMQGKCPKDPENCMFSHDADPPKIMELCKFYLFERCAKREKCLYLHKGFPCKYFHTGYRCLDTAETCKFSHDPLTDVTRGILLKHLESAPKEILGDFPRLSRESAASLVFATEAKNKGWLKTDSPRRDESSGGEETTKSSSTLTPIQEKLAELSGMGGQLNKDDSKSKADAGQKSERKRDGGSRWEDAGGDEEPPADRQQRQNHFSAVGPLPQSPFPAGFPPGYLNPDFSEKFSAEYVEDFIRQQRERQDQDGENNGGPPPRHNGPPHGPPQRFGFNHMGPYPPHMGNGQFFNGPYDGGPPGMMGGPMGMRRGPPPMMGMGGPMMGGPRPMMPPHGWNPRGPFPPQHHSGWGDRPPMEGEMNEYPDRPRMDPRQEERQLKEEPKAKKEDPRARRDDPRARKVERGIDERRSSDDRSPPPPRQEDYPIMRTKQPMEDDNPPRDGTPTPDEVQDFVIDEDRQDDFDSPRDSPKPKEESMKPPKLPKAQQRLYERIQQKQKDRRNSQDSETAEEDASKDDSWYSSDEGDKSSDEKVGAPTAKDNLITNVLKNLEKKPEDVPLPKVLTSVLSDIKASQSPPSSQNGEESKPTGRDPRASRDPRSRDPRKKRQPDAESEKDKRILDIDLGSVFGDLELPALTTSSKEDEPEELDPMGLPFKAHVVHAVAKEIDASIMSHSPLEYRLRKIDVVKLDYNQVIVKHHLKPSQVQQDPRLRRYSKEPGKDDPPPPKQAPPPNPSRVDPRKPRMDPRRSSSEEDQVYNPRRDLYRPPPPGRPEGYKASPVYSPTQDVQDMYNGPPKNNPAFFGGDEGVYNPRQDLGGRPMPPGAPPGQYDNWGNPSGFGHPDDQYYPGDQQGYYGGGGPPMDPYYDQHGPPRGGFGGPPRGGFNRNDPRARRDPRRRD